MRSKAPPPHLSGFAERLAEYVNWAGGATKVAQAMGLSQQMLSAWIGRRYQPSPIWICRLALFFGITPNELLDIQYTRGAEARRLECETEWTGWADQRREAGLELEVKPRPPSLARKRKHAKGTTTVHSR